MVILKVQLESGSTEVEMSSVTTVKYAAKRVAEHLGFDPYERNWQLFQQPDGFISDDVLVSEIQGPVFLAWINFDFEPDFTLE